MAHTCFEVKIEDSIASVTLARPDKRNSMNLEFWDELPQIVNEIDRQCKARVIVIASTGPHFSSGLDINAFFAASQDDTRDERDRRITNGAKFYHNVKLMQDAFSALENCRVPVVAAIQGGCIGGGVDLATACDMRYATDDAFFCVEEINVAMTADVGTFPRLTRLLPEGIVREMCYTGRRVPAAEAKRLGLVNEVYADQQTMLDGVMDIARQIAAKAPLALHGVKHMINYSRDHSTADTLDYVRLWNASMFQPEEVMEAVGARMQKRAGKFVDLPPIKTRVK